MRFGETWVPSKRSSWSPTTREGVEIGLYTFDPGTLGSGFYANKGDGGKAFLREDTNVFIAQLVLGVFGLLVGDKRLRIATIVLIAVSFFVAIGPECLGIPNVVYYALVKASSTFQRLWWPSRALVLGHIGLALLAGAAFVRFGRYAPWAALVTTLAWAAELPGAQLAPMATWEAGVPAGYRCLGEATDGAVIELPYSHTQAHLYYQTKHDRPIFGGMVEDNPVFAPAEQVAFQKDNSFLAVLLDQASQSQDPLVFSPQDRAELATMGYRWVLLDKRAYIDVGDKGARVGTSLEGRARFVRRTLTGLLGAPVYEDEVTAIYAPWNHGSPCPDGVGE